MEQREGTYSACIIRPVMLFRRQQAFENSQIRDYNLRNFYSESFQKHVLIYLSIHRTSRCELFRSMLQEVMQYFCLVEDVS